MMAIFVVGIFASIFQYFYLRQDAFYLSAYRFLEIWVGIFVYWFLVSKNQKIVVKNDWFVGLLVLILLFFPYGYSFDRFVAACFGDFMYGRSVNNFSYKKK